MNETPLEANEIQLTSMHRLHFDKQNITLTRKYQKRGGKGKDAPLIDEYAYKEPSYYGNPKVLINRLFDKEFMEGMSDSDIANLKEFKEIVEHAIEHVEKIKKEVFEHIDKHITIDLGETAKKPTTKKVKGVEVSLVD